MATLKDAIKIAKQEPKSERAKSLLDAILKGTFDAKAVEEEIDLAPIKQASGVKPTGIMSTVLQPMISKAKEEIGQEKAVEQVKEVSPTVGRVTGMIEKAKDTEAQKASEEAYKQTPQGMKEAEEAAHPVSSFIEKGTEKLGEIPYVGKPLEATAEVLTGLPAIKGVETTIGGVAEGSKKLYQAVQDYSDFLSFQPDSDKKGVEALSNLVSGVLGIISAPISGGIEAVGEMPLVGDVAKPVLETAGKVLTPSTYTDMVADKIAQAKGLQEGTPEYEQFVKDVKEPLGNAANVLGLLLAPKLTKKAGEQISKIKPTIKQFSGNISDKLMQNLNRVKKSSQTKFFQQQAESIGTWLNKRKLGGVAKDTIDNVGEYFAKNMEKVNNSLDTIKGNYNIKTAPEDFKLMLKDAYRNAVETRSTELPILKSIVNNFNNKGISMKDINIVKRYFERNNKFTYGKDITAGEKTQWATNIDNAVREWQMMEAQKLGLKNLAELNKETQASKMILNELGAEIAGKLGNNAMSLTDWIMTASEGWQGLVLKKGLTGDFMRLWTSKLFNKLSDRGTKIVNPEIKQLLMLEAPKSEFKKIEYGEQPIELPKKSATTIETEEISKFGK